MNRIGKFILLLFHEMDVGTVSYHTVLDFTFRACYNVRVFDKEDLSLIYFQSDSVRAHDIIEAGADAALVDCEYTGKSARQRGFDTQINHNKPEQAKDIRALSPGSQIMCRVNNDFGGTTEDQIERAIDSGVDAIVLPMVDSVEHIEKANAVIRGRAKLIVMIESQSGVDNLPLLIGGKFSAIYVGLNDLSISRDGRPLFEPLYDGTVKHIIDLSTVPVGVGGVTEPTMGEPVKSEEIIKQYAQLGVRFSILRRSFERATMVMAPDKIIRNIKMCYRQYRL